LVAGAPADFFTIDVDDPSIAGASTSDLLSCLIFSASRATVKDVIVAGNRIVEDGKHPDQQDIVARFVQLQKKLWG
jgi:formimidoylglutamate deiminase